jgi:hypothetical protein
MDDKKMVDMAMTKSEMKEHEKGMCCPVGSDGKPNPYPWGLAIRLESKELAKLGITDLPKVGAEFHFAAMAKVTSVNQSASEGRDEETSVGLQITSMTIPSKE